MPTHLTRENLSERADHIAHVEVDEDSSSHGTSCGCRACDPDFYFDPAERESGERDPRW